MKISKHAINAGSGEAFYIVSMLTRTVLQMPESEWRQIEEAVLNGDWHALEIDQEKKDDLREFMFILDEDFNELEYINKMTLSNRAISSSFGLVIVPTLSCNMNCPYCFEDKSDTRQLDMDKSSSLIEFTRKKLSEHSYEHLHVRWFGGEPLGAPNIITKIQNELMNLCSHLRVQISGDVVTNGYLLNRETAQILRDAGLNSAQVTFEGNRRLHDRIRRVEKQGSYEKLVQNVLDAAEFLDVRLRIHVSPYSIESIPDLLEDLSARGVNRAAKYIYFAPLFNYDQRKKDSAFEADDRIYMTSRIFSDYQVKLSQVAMRFGFKLADPLDTDYSVCTALREYTAVVNPDGSLVKCYMDAGDQSQAYGSVSGTGEWRDENLTKWQRMHFADDPECRKCTFSPICLGGCAKEVMHSADKSAICTPLKYNYKSLIPLIYSS